MERIKKFLFTNSETKQITIKNTFWLFSSEVSVRIFKMILIVYAARILGTKSWGIFSYAISIGALMMIFSDIGINGLITREISQKKENYKSFITTTIIFKFTILIVSLILLIKIAPLISTIKEANILFPLIALIFLFDSLRELGFAINRAFEKMEWEMISKTLMGVTILITGIVLLKQYLTPKALAEAYVIGSASGFIIIFIIILGKLKKIVSKININLFKKIIKITLPFAIISLVGAIMANTDIFMLGIWKDSSEIGLYTVSQRFYQFILIIPATIATAVFPSMSKMVNNNNDKFSKILEKSIGFIMMIIIPIAIGGIILSQELILLVFGNQYLETSSILQIFMLVVLISSPLMLLSNSVFSYNKQRELTPVYLIAIIINISLNYLLIPKFGAIGAAISTLCSTTIIVYISWIKMKKINNFHSIKKLSKIVFASVVMGIISLILKKLEINTVLNIIISAIAYLSILVIIKEKLLLEAKNILKT